MVEIPHTENLINEIRAGGSISPRESIPNIPEKKLKPKIIKPFSASLRNFLTTLSLYAVGLISPNLVQATEQMLNLYELLLAKLSKRKY